MTTYEVLVADGLLPEFNNDNPSMPAGFQVLEVLTEPDARQAATWVRVSDENAPAWTEGKRVDISFTAHRDPDRAVPRTTVNYDAIVVGTVEESVAESKAHPGVRVEVRS